MAVEEDASAAFAAGVERVGAGDIPGALEHFNRACATSGESPRYQLYRAWARYQTSHAIPAADVVRTSCRATIIHALQAEPRFDAGYVLLGTILLSEERTARARECFLKALSLNAENAGAQMGLKSCATR